jgi:hypothetical protein
MGFIDVIFHKTYLQILQTPSAKFEDKGIVRTMLRFLFSLSTDFLDSVKKI